MKYTKCSLCGKKVEIADSVTSQQHVLCPFCGGKFSYLSDSEELSEERLAYAIAECRKDPNDNAYYSAAPAGARLYIGLLFYGKCFKDNLNVERYFAALNEVEPELGVSDWQYLLEHEDDAELKSFFRNQLNLLTGDVVQGTREARPVATGRPKLGIMRPKQEAPSEAPNPVVDRRLEMERQRNAAEAARQVREWRQKIVGNVVLTVCVVAVLALGYVFYNSWREREDASRREAEEVRARIAEETRATEEKRMERERMRKLEEAAQIKRREEERKRESERLKKESESRAQAEAAASQVLAEQNRKQEELRKRRERYENAAQMFTDDPIVFWDDVRPGNRPGVGAGKWCCAVAVPNGGYELYEVVGSASAQPAVSRLSTDRDPEPVAYSNLESQVVRNGGVYTSGEKTIVRGCERIENVAIKVPEGDATVAPGKDCLGGILPLLRELKTDLSSIRFVVDMQSKDEKAVVTQFGVDDEIGREPFEEAVRQLLMDRKMSKVGSKSVSVRKPRVTVVEYGGDIVKKGANGVTQVPRKFMYEGQGQDLYCTGSRYWSDYRNGSRCNCNNCKKKRKIEKARSDWERLKEQAAEQALAMSEYEAELKKAIANKKKQVAVTKNEIAQALRYVSVSYSRIKEGSDEEQPVRRMAPQEEDDNLTLSWSGDMLPDALVRRMNERLRIKSVCGVPFGTLDSDLRPGCGKGGTLVNRFRWFECYSVYGSSLHRVDKIVLNATKGGLDAEAVRQEVRAVLSLLEKKYAVKFSKTRDSERVEEYCGASDDLEIRLRAYLSAQVSLSLDFISKEVQRQDEQLEKARKRTDVSMPANEGLDVL